jgi:hypothetical protein
LRGEILYVQTPEINLRTEGQHQAVQRESNLPRNPVEARNEIKRVLRFDGITVFGEIVVKTSVEIQGFAIT